MIAAIKDYLTVKMCDWFHGGGDIKRDASDRINWQCRLCGRWAGPVSKIDEAAICKKHLQVKGLEQTK